jgi:hypothetical protein
MSDDTTCTVKDCNNPSDGWFVCKGCGESLTRILGDLYEWLLADIDLVVTGQTRYALQAGKSAETPLMFNAKAAEICGSLTIALDQSAATVAEANGWNRDYSTPGECVRWLHRSISAIRLHPEGAFIVETITAWYDEAIWVVDRPAQRHYLGDCTADFEGVPCETGRVYGKSKKPEARCDVCGATYDAADRRASLLTQLDNRIVSAAEFAHLATYLGLPLDRAQVRKRVNQWHHRKQVERRNPKEDEATPTFRFADLLALVYRDEQLRTDDTLSA